MTELQNLTVAQLRKVVSIKEQIEGLEADLTAIIGDGAARSQPPSGPRRVSAAGRARIAAAQRARWAKMKGATSQPSPKTKRKLSSAAKAKIAAAARARWAKAKAAGRNSL